MKTENEMTPEKALDAIRDKQAREELETRADRALYVARCNRWVYLCHKCRDAWVFDRAVLVDRLRQDIPEGSPRRWDKIGERFALIESLLWLNGYVHFDAKTVEEDGKYVAVCKGCYHDHYDPEL